MERDAGRDVGLNQACDHVYRWALGCQNQVYACGTGFLRQAGNLLLHFFAFHHHQIGQFINDDHDVRQFFQGFWFIGREAEWVEQRFVGFTSGLYFVIKACQLAHAHVCEQAVATLHFGHAPIEGIGSLLHVGHDRREQMGDTFIYRQFQHFRVYHDEAHFFGRGLVEHGQNHGIDGNRFARTRGACHQNVGHFAQISHHGHACNVFAHGKREFGFG